MLFKEKPAWADTSRRMACPLLCHGERHPQAKISTVLDDQEKKSYVEQLRDEYMRDRVNVGVENSGPMGVVEFWDNVYLPFIESNNHLEHATVHGYKQVWNQHRKRHSGTLQLTDYKTHITSNFSTGLAKTLRPRTLNCIKWLASAICSCRCNRQLRNEPHQGCNGAWQDVGPWGYQIVHT